MYRAYGYRGHKYCAYFWHNGWWNFVQFGIHVDFSVPNLEIHVPFGFVRIGVTGEYRNNKKVLKQSEDSQQIYRRKYREAWEALSMIRETVETLGPVGCVRNAEYLEPSFMHEAEALVEGIVAIGRENDT